MGRSAFSAAASRSAAATLAAAFLTLVTFAAPAAGAAATELELDGSAGTSIEGHATRFAQPIRDGAFELEDFEPNTHDEPGMNIVWTNRGPGDGFDTVFGGGLATDAARANIDAALDAWEAVVRSLNRPGTPGDDRIDVTINMNPGGTPTSCGGSASGNFDGDGWPTGGAINVNGNANVWFIDPTPHDNSEFSGNIDNAFSGDAQAGSPAAGLCDIYTVVVAEIIHILGITNDGGSRWLTGGFTTQLTASGTTCNGPGDLWQFTGASITALMTSNNGGSTGSDFGVPIHTAEPCATFGGLSGANDGGNANFEGGRRYLPANSVALILRDTYNFSIAEPERFATFYSVLNTTTGNLTVRGSDDTPASDDTISVTRDASGIVASVDVENDVPGTGPTDAFVTRFDEGEVLGIGVDGDNGDDLISLGTDLGITVSATGGAGDDTIIGTDGPDQLNGEGGDDTIDGRGGGDAIDGGSGNDAIEAGGGSNSVVDGSGDDVVDLSNNAVGVTFTTSGGNDSVLGTRYDDTITGSSGSDHLSGGPGNDVLTGGGSADELFGDSGSDVFPWAAGDGDDIVEGGSGEHDALDVTTGGTAELLRLRTASGSRLLVDTTTGTSLSIDAADVETVDVHAGAGSDEIRVTNISTTQVRSVRVWGDAGADELIVRGTSSDDVLQAALEDGIVEVAGLRYGVAFVDSSGSDQLTLNGRAGDDIIVVHGTDGADAITVASLSRYGATVSGGLPATVKAVAAEKLIADGDGGDDALTIESPSGPDKVTVTPGDDDDRGRIKVRGRLPTIFRDLGDGGQVELVNSGGGRADIVVHTGTPDDDTYVVSSDIVLDDRIPIIATGAEELRLAGGADDDRFELTAGLPYSTTRLRGGTSTDGDSASMSGAGGPVQLDYGSRSISGFGGSVVLKAIEEVETVQTGTAGTDLTILGSGRGDEIAYTPTSSLSGEIELNKRLTLVFDGSAGTLTIDPLGGDDDVAVLGTLGDDNITALADTVTSIQVGGWKTALIPQSTTEVVSIESGEGEDLIDVTVFNGADAVLTVSGDLDVAKRFSDEMIVRNGSSGNIQYNDVKSHVKESGSIFARYNASGSETRIDYVDVENLTLIH